MQIINGIDLLNIFFISKEGVKKAKEYALFGLWRALIWLQCYKMWIYPQYHEVHSNHNPVLMIWLLKRQGPRWPVLLCTTTTVLLKSKNIYRYMYKWMSLHCPCICMAVKFWIMETSKECCIFHVHIGKSLAKAFL